MTSEHDDPRDAAHWTAVESATEVLLEGDYERGLSLLKEVLQADRSNPYAYHYLGAALFDLQKFREAHDAYRAAVKLSPRYLAARVGLAHTLRLLERPGASLREAQQALAFFPDDGAAHHAAGLALGALGERDRAIEHLERFLATRPELEAQLEARQVVEMLKAGGDGAAEGE